MGFCDAVLDGLVVELCCFGVCLFCGFWFSSCLSFWFLGCGLIVVLAFAGLVVVLGIVVFDCVFLGLVLFGLRFWWVLVWFGRVFDAGFGLCVCAWFLV